MAVVAASVCDLRPKIVMYVCIVSSHYTSFNVFRQYHYYLNSYSKSLLATASKDCTNTRWSYQFGQVKVRISLRMRTSITFNS